MDKRNDDARFRQPGMFAALALLFLFIVFVYGAFILGLLEIANWIVHAWHLTLFLEAGFFGVVLTALCLLAAWLVIVFAIAALPYYYLRKQGRYKRASHVALVILLLLFNVFALPFILWPMVRNASPKLRAKRWAKLRHRIKNRETARFQEQRR